MELYPGTRTLLRYRVRSRNVLVQSREHCTVCSRKLAQVTIRYLFRRPDPMGEMRNIVCVRNEPERSGLRFLELQQ